MKKLPNNRGGAPLFMIIFLLFSTGLVERAHARELRLPPQATITGTVSDADGIPLPGVHIQVESTKAGTISDLDGTFSIQAGAEDVLVFSIVGFKRLEVPIGGRQHLEISLEQDVTQLGEVVLNAGYYTVKEKERTGNISKVTAVEIEKQPISNPLASLQGKVAGVEITQTSGLPGAKFNIRIRGRNSIRSDANEPLYIVDGVPYSSTSLGEGQASMPLTSGAISPLNNINPTDIESIEVLKDADATAIYGSRGANGVVLITTKKGDALGTKVEINVLTGMGKVNSTIDLLGTNEYLALRHEAFSNDGITEYPYNAYDVNGTWDPKRETDWQKVIFGKTSYLTNIQGSVSGGNAQTNFLISGNYHNQTSVFPGDYGNDKVSFLANVGHISENNRLNIQLSTSFTTNNNNLPGGGLLVVNSLYLPPNAPKLYNEDGSLNWENSTWSNPLADLNRKYNSNATTLISNLTLGLKISEELEAKTNLGYTENRLTEINTTPSTVFDPMYGAGPQYSNVLHNNGKRASWIVEPQIHFNKRIGNMKLGALAGLTFQEQNSERISQYAQGFTSNNLLENLSAASVFFPLSDINQKYRYHAAYGRFNFGYKERYYFNITGRRDGSSRFGPNKRFGNFGAIGVAWLFSEENLIQKNASFLTFGKIRASYGTSGSDQIGDYQFLDTYSLGTNQYQGIYGLSTTRLFNPDYNWEKNEKFEIALDLGLFNDRFYVSGSFYRNRSSNQLVGTTLPGTTGFATINGNLDAIVENTGLELELNSVNINSNNFQWTTSFNITIPNNRLVSFPNLDESTYANQLVIGEPLNITKRYKWNGVDPDTGLHTFHDFNGDGILSFSDDRGILRTLNPKYYGGLTNNFSIGKFHLGVLFQFTKQLGENVWSIGSMPGRMANQSKSVLNRWQLLEGEGNHQRFSNGTPETESAFLNFTRSDASISDASFIRLKNVSVTYRVVEKAIHGYSLHLFLRSQNLFTWTNYLGLDPESRNPQSIPSLRMLSIGTRFIF